MRSNAEKSASVSPVAIVGLSCRFPGADNPAAFWDLLCEGGDAIVEIPANRWDIEAFYDPDLIKPLSMYSRCGGFLDQVDRFDPGMFGISSFEAKHMDPQQRLLLEVTWEAVEDAALPLAQLQKATTGVFVAVGGNDYGDIHRDNPDHYNVYSVTGNHPGIAANRISHCLGFNGPSFTVNAASSSVLVALHLASQSLCSGECDAAVVGGANVILSPLPMVALRHAGLLSSSGCCRVFDAEADGLVMGEGCGVVVLKRLEDAIAMGDPVRAVVAGSAVNHDGHGRHLLHPGAEAQRRVLRRALEFAGVEARQIDYVEIHGAGKAEVDAIEVNALAGELATGRSKEHACFFGSVKANVGYLDAAGSIAGLIKTVMSIERGVITPQINLERMNPAITWNEDLFEISRSMRPWLKRDSGRCAGVHGFGMGGTNAHVVLQEAPAPPLPAMPARTCYALNLSAQSRPALLNLAARYADWLSAERLDEGPSALRLGDVCHTVNATRQSFDCRHCVAASSLEELQRQLALLGTEAPENLQRAAGPEKVAFLFTGQGAQYAGMGRDLYESQSVFREVLDHCDTLLRRELEYPLLSVLYPAAEKNGLLDSTIYTQPAIFALQCALTQMWRAWGIEPEAVLGHSVGEFAAAYCAGIFSLEEGLHLIAARARLMGALPDGGGMAVALAARRTIEDLLEEERSVTIAAVNGPQNTVISGRAEAVERAADKLEDAFIGVQPLRVSHAFHSPLMEPMLDDFEAVADQVDYRPPQIPMVSNLSGAIVQEPPNARYWRRHVREPVLFADGIRCLIDSGFKTFVEIGPSNTLIKMGKRCAPDGKFCWLSSLQSDGEDWSACIPTLTSLSELEHDIDWDRVDDGGNFRRLHLPTYPFRRDRYWLDSRKVHHCWE